MKIRNLWTLITEFFEASEDWEWFHLKVKSSTGKRELFIPNEQARAPETLKEKVERIRKTPPEQLSPEDSEWWQDTQFKLSQSKEGKQVSSEDTTETVLQKLAGIGIH